MSALLHETVWQAGVALRDRLDPQASRDVVLGLVALRALDRAADRPNAAAWDGLRSSVQISRAIDAWHRARPELRRALTPPPPVETRRLDPLMHALTHLDPDESPDLIGSLYMLLLGGFARSEGRRGGQYFTPPDVAELLVALVGPICGDVYDPSCGSGGLLLAAARAATAPVRCLGQELNPSTWRLGHLSAAVHNIPLDLGDQPADTLHHDLHPDLIADRVLANPPFNLSAWGAPTRKGDPRWALGLPPDRSANLAWIQHALHHLHPEGRGAILLANGSLTARSADERALRRALVQSGRVEAIVALPDRLFWTTSIPSCVWVLGRAGERGVLMIDARHLGSEPIGATRSLPPEVRTALAERLARARTGQPVDEPGLACAVPTEELIQGEVRLSPGAFVGVRRAVKQADPKGLEATVEALRTTTARAHTLDEQLLSALDALELRR